MSQHPKVRLDKRKGRRPTWIANYYDASGKRRMAKLGPKSDTTKAEAQVALDALLAPINRQRAVLRPITPQSTLAHFVEAAYIPHGERKWKKSTAGTTKQRIRQHVGGGSIAGVRLIDLNRTNMQAFLDGLGFESESVVSHLRWDLKAICDLAVTDGLIPRNQALELYVPQTVKLPERPVMTAEQAAAALAVLDLRERLFCRLAIFAGMRPGEIIALKWPDIEAGMARVDDRYYKGRQGTTKNRRPRMVALSASVQSDLKLWRAFAIDVESFIFPSEAGTPMKYENLWQREIRPRLKKIGLGWADFRAMRRTNATLMNAAGADPKVSADNRGHGVGVSQDVYTHATADQKAEAVKKLEGFIQ